MLDPKFIRNNPNAVRAGIKAKNMDDTVLDEFLAADNLWRKAVTEVDALKALRNTVSEEISLMKRNREDASEKIARMREVSNQIKEMDSEVRMLEEKVQNALLYLPNLPHESVPVSQDESGNRVVRTWGEEPSFNFIPLPHWDLTEKLGLVDFERGAKLAGSGFILYTGVGARLQRALFNWMVDFHAERHGFKEVLPPTLANRECMVGTGQLPKF